MIIGFWVGVVRDEVVGLDHCPTVNVFIKDFPFLGRKYGISLALPFLFIHP